MAKGIKKLPLNLLDDVRNYSTALARKKQADSESRTAESTVKALKSKLMLAMGQHDTATVGNIVLTTRYAADVPASIVLPDGSKVLWATVTSLLIGNRTIPANEVGSIYGGRTGSVGLEVTGTP